MPAAPKQQLSTGVDATVGIFIMMVGERRGAKTADTPLLDIDPSPPLKKGLKDLRCTLHRGGSGDPEKVLYWNPN